MKDAEEVGDDLPRALDRDRGVEAFGQVALAELGEQAVDQGKAAVEPRGSTLDPIAASVSARMEGVGTGGSTGGRDNGLRPSDNSQMSIRR